MAQSSKKLYHFHVGDKIHINNMDDPYDHTYNGREGIIEHIDDAGQIHGTWGGLALIPGVDDFIVLEAGSPADV